MQWVYSLLPVIEAAKQNEADLFPVLTVDDERKKFLHFSDPYLESESCLVFRADSPFNQVSDLSGALVSVLNRTAITRKFSSLLPNSRPLIEADATEALRKVCSHASDAAFLEEGEANLALLSGVCGNVPLKIRQVPNSRSFIAVGSTFEAREAADAIREEIGQMAREGKLPSIVSRWVYYSSSKMEALDALISARRREQYLWAWIGIMGLMIVGAVWQALRIKREQTRTKSAEQEKEKLQEQLRQSQKLESVGILAGGIAHDFNNLLTVINGYSEMILSDTSADNPNRLALIEIQKSGHRAAELTQQLLAFSRRQVIQPKVLNLNEIITGSISMYRRLMGEDLELVVTLAPSLKSVFVDAGQMQQVLMNLVVNARDAMKYGGKLLIETSNVELDEAFVAHHAEVVPGSYVQLSVTDTGHGMDENTREHIFEPFFTTKPVGEGTGLGLATVYGIVRQNKGWIWVYSEPDKGSIFKIHLPCCKANETVQEETKPQESITPARRGERILVVEDQPEVRSYAVAMLTRSGYRVEPAASGSEALELTRDLNKKIDLLITDVVLSGMNGKQLADLLVQQRPELKVLYMSGYPGDLISSRYRVLENVDLLPKPFTSADLTAKVRSILDRV